VYRRRRSVSWTDNLDGVVMAITDFLRETGFGNIPETVTRQSRLWFLDLVGVAAAGSRTPLSGLIRDHACAHFAAGGRGARILFDGRTVSPPGAALAGGMTIDALDAHDGHRLTKGHAGCGALPAVLAYMDAEDIADGRELLIGLILGYEIGTRAGIALHRLARDYHTSGAWVAVAAAAIGVRLLGLGGPAARHAIGIGEYHGPRSPMMRCIDHPTMVKDGSGWGAMAGVSAAYLAQDGFTGAPATLVDSPDTADLWRDLGQRWRILEQYYKPFPVCRWAQPAIEAALALKAAHGIAADDIARIEVESFDEAVRLATRRPQTTEEAQYSLPFPVAAATVRGRLGIDEVAGDVLGDPGIRRLSETMALTADPALSARFPERRVARVRFLLRNGSILSSGDTEAFGDPERPATADRIRDKFETYAEPVLSAGRTRTIARTIEAIGTDTSGHEPILGQLLASPPDGLSERLPR